jgi:putative peptidoglycan lipid II flippase
MKKFFEDRVGKTVAGGAMIIAVFSVISKLLGLLRDRLLAVNFGAGDVLDTYYAAFRLPDLIFNTLVLGALAAAFIPVFIDYWQKDKDEAFKIANSIMNLIFVFLTILGIILFILARPLIGYLVAPGFSPDKQLATAELTRIMLLSIVFFGLSNVVSSILNSFKKFLAYSLAPVMYNLGIILGIIFLVPKFGPIGLAWGVVVGSLLHLIIQLPAVFKTGWHWQPVLNWRHSGVKKIAVLMLPRTFGLAINQVNQLIITIIASTLAVGSVAVFNLANNLQHMPIGILAIPLAVACFPYLSENISQNKEQEFVINFSVTLRRILFLIIPASIFIFLLRAQVVRIVLGAGEFDWQDTVLTLKTLGWFSLSLFAQSLIPLLARSFYALKDTKTPVLSSLISVAINIGLGLYLGKIMGVPGLALAFSIGSILNMTILFLILRTRFKWLDEKKICWSFLRIIVISLISGIFLQLTKNILGEVVDMQRFHGVFLQFLIAGGVGCGVFFSLALAFKMEEVDAIKKIFNSRLGRFLRR